MDRLAVRPRALFFDLDDTLADFTTARRRALNDLAMMIAANVPGTDAAAIKAARQYRGASIGQGAGLEQQRHDAWEEVLRAVGADGRFDPNELVDHHDRLTAATIQLFPDAVDALQEAAARFELTGIISNGPSHTQWAEVRAMDLEPQVGRVIVAGDVGAYKPDRRIFEAALRDTGIPTADAAFVGNSPHHDVVGALEAGWQALWLNRDAQPYPDDLPPPTAVVRSLTDLLVRFEAG